MNIELETDGVRLGAAEKRRLVRRLTASLGRLAPRLGRVTVRLEDVVRDGDRGCAGLDRYLGHVRIRFRDGDEVRFRVVDGEVEALVARLTERAERAAARRVSRADERDRRSGPSAGTDRGQASE